MTAQIEDRFLHRKKRFSLVAITDSIGFDPREYGLIQKQGVLPVGEDTFL